jgi:hypothetical protein
VSEISTSPKIAISDGMRNLLAFYLNQIVSRYFEGIFSLHLKFLCYSYVYYLRIIKVRTSMVKHKIHRCVTSGFVWGGRGAAEGLLTSLRLNRLLPLLPTDLQQCFQSAGRALFSMGKRHGIFLEKLHNKTELIIILKLSEIDCLISCSCQILVKIFTSYKPEIPPEELSPRRSGRA